MVKWKWSLSAMSDSLRPCGLWPTRLPPFMGLSRQEYWSGLPFPSPGDLPNPGIEPGSPALEANALTSEPQFKSRKYMQSIECSAWHTKPSINVSCYFVSYSTAAAAAAKSLQLCQTLCNPIDGNPPGSAVPEILQAGTLEWVAISFSINNGRTSKKTKKLTR